jgi:K+-sensing histidine kinase KdpD
MQTVDLEHIPAASRRKSPGWQNYVMDTALAVFGSLLITGIIAESGLYPRIPDIAVIYLLLIIALATLRNRYASIAASVVAFLSFDYFLIPPLYTFTIADATQWVALLIFLVTALVTSQLSGAVRRQSEEVRIRERNLRILYELLRVYNSTDNMNEQLDAIVLATARVFSSWGVDECAVLLPDEHRQLTVRADAPIRVTPFEPTSDEIEMAQKAYQNGSLQFMEGKNAQESVTRFIPFKIGSHVFGVMYLRVRAGSYLLSSKQLMPPGQSEESLRAEFFWTVLDQITSLVERSLLRMKVK